jgi:tetratricopeptide (TPR) repeat protein
VERCASCRRRVSLLQRIESAGVDAIADSAAEVDDLLTSLLAARRSTWWRVVREPEYRRPDLARRLLFLGMDASPRDRQLAIDFVRAAADIADGLVTGAAAVRDLRFDAWQYLSLLFREAGRYKDTADALVAAERAAAAATDPELAKARVLVSQALLCAEPDYWKPVEAGILLDRAEAVFAVRDSQRLRATTITRAFLQSRSGDLMAAHETFARLLQETPPTPREEYLDTLSNVMWTEVELLWTRQRRDAASTIDRNLELLVRENTGLKRPVQVARAHWMLGRIRTLRGDYETARHAFARAIDGIGEPDAEIRIGIDLISALLLAQDHDKVDDLARRLAAKSLALDRREPTRRRNLTAQVYAYVREAAERHALTPDLVAELALYLDRITRQPPIDFIPPMPLAAM